MMLDAGRLQSSASRQLGQRKMKKPAHTLQLKLCCEAPLHDVPSKRAFLSVRVRASLSGIRFPLCRDELLSDCFQPYIE